MCLHVHKCESASMRMCAYVCNVFCVLPLTRCQCSSGYTGRLCEVDVNECDPSPCLNGATCVDGQGSFTCRCPPGFNGTRCETGIDAIATESGRWSLNGQVLFRQWYNLIFSEGKQIELNLPQIDICAMFTACKKNVKVNALM